ncbi:CAP-Gly domain-containing linker protein 1-like [Malaya genurostris]|uniref:CAP-Gly domain-containing linker protein 1-like n=1 Tax=Malaya genurostris TaxID=325434 RepID=UPI0026F394C1|nr:CAP-Gly domain-containing linker protein 1-like [Malaya genurostris]
MSYTTQKDFFNVAFRNEDPKPPERKRSDGALMTYEFCTDGRAWALDKDKRSKYILDGVHKTRFKKAVPHPEGQFELSRDDLMQMEVSDLAGLIVNLQDEIKRKNETVQQHEQTRRSLGEQLKLAQQQSHDQMLIQQQSAILEQERNEFEQQIEDLEEVIVGLKDRADRYDLVAKENELLRCRLMKLGKEADNRMRLATAEAEANFNRMRADDCEKLEAELIVFKAEYEELRKQKRELKEEVQKASICKVRLSELKRQLAAEQAHREKVEDEMEHLLALYDEQYQELQRKNDYIVEANQRMESLQYDQHWQQDHGVPAIEEPLTASSSIQTLSKPSTSAELLVESCQNCKRMETEIAQLKNQQGEFDHRNDARVQQLIEELKRCQDEQRALLTSIEVLENELAGHQKRLKDANQRIEQLLEKLESSQSQVDLLRRDYETRTKELADREAEESKSLELQKQLARAREELSRKSAELDSVSIQNERLSSSLSNYQSRIEDLEERQQLKADELAASRTELETTKEQLNQYLSDPNVFTDKSELDAAMQLNNDLQKNIDRLRSELAAAQAYSKELLENSGDNAELLKTIADLKTEIRTINSVVKEQEEEIARLGGLTVAGSLQQLQKRARSSPSVEPKSGDTQRDRSKSTGALGVERSRDIDAPERTPRLRSEGALGAERSRDIEEPKKTIGRKFDGTLGAERSRDIEAPKETTGRKSAGAVGADSSRDIDAPKRSTSPRSTGAHGSKSSRDTDAPEETVRRKSASALSSKSPRDIDAPERTVRRKSTGALDSTSSRDIPAQEQITRVRSTGAIGEIDFDITVELTPEATKSTGKTDKADLDLEDSVRDPKDTQLKSSRAKSDAGYGMAATLASQDPPKSAKPRSKSAGEIERTDKRDVVAKPKLTGATGRVSSAGVGAGIRKKSPEAFDDTGSTRPRKPSRAISGTVGAISQRKSLSSTVETDSAIPKARIRTKSAGSKLEASSTRTGPKSSIGRVDSTRPGVEPRTKSVSIVDEAETVDVASPKAQLEYTGPPTKMPFEKTNLKDEETKVLKEDAVDRKGAADIETPGKTIAAELCDAESEEPCEVKKSAGRIIDSSRQTEQQSRVTAEETIAAVRETDLSDLNRTKIIAMKIVQHGISILILPELDYLHREIYHATLKRYFSLGKTVQFLDDAFCDNCNILNTMQTMGNKELRAMISSPVKVPTASPVVLEDQIPTRLPPEPSTSRRQAADGSATKSKPRAKTASSAETKDAKCGTSSASLYPNRKANDRLLIDRCRTRPWRAMKTPPK